MSDTSSIRTNGWAIAGFILGLVGLISAFVVGFYVGLFLAVFGIALSADGLRRATKVGNGRGLAIAGLVLSILTLAFGVFRLILLLR